MDIVSIIVIFIALLCLFFISKTPRGKKMILQIFQAEIKLKKYGLFGIILYIIIGIILNITLFLYMPVNIMSGFLFGFKKGFLISYCIVMISAIISFYIAKYFLKEKIEKNIEKYEKLLEIYKKQDTFTLQDWFMYVILTRVSPVPFNFSNYFWGITKISVFVFILSSSIGVLPWFFFEVLGGSKIKHIEKLL